MWYFFQFPKFLSGKVNAIFYLFLGKRLQQDDFFFQVLRDQGLGKYCDPEFVRAASREMQEAMDMTAEEFDQAAHRLLQAEQAGQIRLPLTAAAAAAREGGGAGAVGGSGAAAGAGRTGGARGGGGGGGGAGVSWGDEVEEEEGYLEDEETMPLRQPPARFTVPGRQPGDRGGGGVGGIGSGVSGVGVGVGGLSEDPSVVVVSPPAPSPTASAGASSVGTATSAAAAAAAASQRRPRGRSRTTPDRSGADRGGVPVDQRGKDFRRDPIG